MLMIKRYLRGALLGLIVVLMASINLFCVVIDNDGDGDPTTGATIEFHAVQGKRMQVGTNQVHLLSTFASKMLQTRFFPTPLSARSDDPGTPSGFFNLIDLLASRLRC